MDIKEFVAPEIRNILDKREKFIDTYDFSQHSIDDVHKVAGDVTDRMKEFFIADYVMIEWFYSPAVAFGGESPHDYTVKNDTERLEQVISAYEYGNFSSL